MLANYVGFIDQKFIFEEHWVNIERRLTQINVFSMFTQFSIKTPQVKEHRRKEGRAMCACERTTRAVYLVASICAQGVEGCINDSAKSSISLWTYELEL